MGSWFLLEYFLNTSESYVVRKSTAYLGVWTETAKPQGSTFGGVRLQVLVFGRPHQHDRLAVLSWHEGPVLRHWEAEVAALGPLLDHRDPGVQVEGPHEGARETQHEYEGEPHQAQARKHSLFAHYLSTLQSLIYDLSLLRTASAHHQKASKVMVFTTGLFSLTSCPVSNNPLDFVELHCCKSRNFYPK